MIDEPSYRPGEVIDGRYRIERLLGRGMSEVYEVVDESIQERRALKILPTREQNDPDAIDLNQPERAGSKEGPQLPTAEVSEQSARGRPHFPMSQSKSHRFTWRVWLAMLIIALGTALAVAIILPRVL